MQIETHAYCPKGSFALWRNGQVVWMGPVGSPICDVECDKITMHADDHDRLMQAVEAHNNHPVTKIIHAALVAARENLI